MISYYRDTNICTMLRVSNFPYNSGTESRPPDSESLVTPKKMKKLFREGLAGQLSNYRIGATHIRMLESFKRMGIVFIGTSSQQSDCEPALEKLGFERIGKKFRSEKYQESSIMSYWIMAVPDFFKAIDVDVIGDLEKEIVSAGGRL